MSDEKNGSQEPRRRLLKTVATGGSALGLTALPGKWAKPMVASVVLPAHAQTSTAPGCAPPSCSMINCPDGYERKYETYSGENTFGFPVDDLPGEITYSGGFLSGSYSKYDDIEGEDGSKYFSLQTCFDGAGSTSTEVSFQARYGEEVYGLCMTFNGSYSGAGGGYREYDGVYTKYFQGCYPAELQTLQRQSPQGSNSLREALKSRDFQFGRWRRR